MNNTNARINRTLMLLLLPFAMLILQACSTGSAPAPEETTLEKIAGVQSTLPEGKPGEVGQEYDFTFVYDSNAATSSSMNVFNVGNEVVFRWAWGDGTGDDAIVTVDADGFAYLEVKHAYSAGGLYGIVVTVEEPETSGGEPGAQLAKFDYVVQIGQLLETEQFVLQCDGSQHPQAPYRGERGVHHHVWDISNAPAGATIDMWFDTVGQPDKYAIEYPAGTIAHDTGWRGDHVHYESKPELYPGGLAGPRIGTVEEMITKVTGHDFLEMTIIGPDKGTVWYYTLTCNQ